VVGVKLIDTVQLPPTASAVPAAQLPAPLLLAKSPALAPPMLSVAMVSAAEPVLLSVTVCALLVVPSDWAGNTSALLFDDSAPNAVAVPVPFKVTVDGLWALSLWTMLKVAARLPLAAGVNTSDTLQDPPAATLPPAEQVEAESIV
jgi:hypothetical protein